MFLSKWFSLFEMLFFPLANIVFRVIAIGVFKCLDIVSWEKSLSFNRVNYDVCDRSSKPVGSLAFDGCIADVVAEAQNIPCLTELLVADFIKAQDVIHNKW